MGAILSEGLRQMKTRSPGLSDAGATQEALPRNAHQYSISDSKKGSLPKPQAAVAGEKAGFRAYPPFGRTFDFSAARSQPPRTVPSGTLGRERAGLTKPIRCESFTFTRRKCHRRSTRAPIVFFCFRSLWKAMFCSRSGSEHRKKLKQSSAPVPSRFMCRGDFAITGFLRSFPMGGTGRAWRSEEHTSELQ